MVEGAGANKESGVRVRGSLFGHGALQKTPPVHTGALFCTECAFENASRTRGKRLPVRNFELHNRGGLGTFTR